MRFCANCGSRLPEGANFCIECGTPASAPEKTTRLERPEGTPSDEGAANAAAPEGDDQKTTVMPAAVQAPVSVLDETRRASRANAEGAHASAGAGVGANARAGAAPATDNPYLQGAGQTAGTQSKAKAKPSALKPALIGGGIGLAFVLGLGIAFAVSGANANKEAAPAPQVQEQQKGDNGASAKAGGNAAGAADESSSNGDVKPRASVEQYSWGELGKVAQKMYAAGSRRAALDVAEEYGLARGGKLVSGVKAVKMSDGTEVQLRLVGLMHDDKADGSGQAAMTFVAKNANWSRRMASGTTTDGGWKGSELRTWMNGELKDKLPEELAKVVVPVQKVSNNVGKASSGMVTTPTTDTLWAPSIIELTGAVDWNYDSDPANSAFYNSVFNGEGDQYEYFAQQRVVSDANNSCLACGGSWWLRSTAASSGRGRHVDASGNPSTYGNSNDSLGVVVGLCI